MKFISEEDILAEKDWYKDKGYKKKVLLENPTDKTALQINIVNPKTTLQSHYHKNMIESVYVLTGEAILIIDGKEFPMKANEIITIEPNEIHTVRNDSTEEFKYLVFKSNVKKDDKFVT